MRGRKRTKMKNSVKSILKRSITAALAALLAIMSFAIAGCSNSEDDLDYVKKNGKLVIGEGGYGRTHYAYKRYVVVWV